MDDNGDVSSEPVDPTGAGPRRPRRAGAAWGWFLPSLVAGLLLIMSLATGCGVDPVLHRPNVIAASPDGTFLVVNDAQAHRLVVLDRDFRLVREITHPQMVNVWGLWITDAEIIASNYRTLGLGKTRAERDALSILEFLFFDHQGRLLRTWAWEGRKGALKAAGAFHRDPDGSILIVDSRQDCVVRFDPQGREAGFIATHGVDPGQLWYPNDIKKTPDGKVLVLDEYNSRLQLFEPDGTFLRVAVGKGEAPGTLNFPQFMAFDPQGDLYVTELGTMRISVFDREFRFLRTMEPPRESDKDLFQLFGICLLASPTRVVTVDSLNNKLYVFDDQGKFLQAVDQARPN